MIGTADVWALRSRRVVLPEGERPAVVVVNGERIAEVRAWDDPPVAVPIEDVGDLAVLPGLVDTHVHINEPGRTDWEGFATATRAAAAGGITTLVDMPLNSSPVTTTREALAAKRRAAAGQLWVDVGFYGGVVPGNHVDLPELIADGVFGFKAFLCDSGLDEFPAATELELRPAMHLLAEHGLPLLVHAELVGPLPTGVEEAFAANPRSYQAYLATRPPEWEVNAIRFMIDLCRETRCHVHIVHLATADALPVIAAAKQEGLPLTVETCPHYLLFRADTIPNGDPRFKCAPPIRSNAHQEFLSHAVLRGLIDTIGTDHSPCPAAMKHLAEGNLQRAWGGIASLQFLLPAIWKAGHIHGDRTGRQPNLQDIVRWTVTNPAKLLQLESERGSLAPGLNANLVVLDPEQLPGRDIHHRHPVTPYSQSSLLGHVERTYLRGRLIFADGKHIGSPTGRTLSRHDL